VSNPTHWVLFGPPGTGKTRSVIEAVGRHLDGHPGRYALLCSHTRAAAQTAVERWGKKTGRMDIQTLHSFCFKQLKLSRAQTVDETKLAFFMDQFGMDLEEGGEGKQYLEIVSFAGSIGITVQESYEKSSRPGTYAHFQSFWATYQKWKLEFGYVDFNDMLHRYVQRPPAATGHTLLAIDEAQDLTPLHWQVVYKFMEGNPKCRVFVAGDDDQCIYSYTGANPHGASEFAERFSAGTRVLDQSYRVPRRVFDLSQTIIHRVGRRVDKNYLPRPEDGGVFDSPRGFEEFGQSWDPNGTDDILVLYSDRYVRKEIVETLLHDLAIPYVALSGFPSPYQTKAGAALRLAHTQTVFDADDEKTLRRGASEKGQDIFNRIGPETFAARIRGGDVSLLSIHWSVEDYVTRCDWRANPRVRISTIHGAKGMEAAQVHLITGQSQAAVAHSFTDPDAAHRLFYVAVTRASSGLTLYPGDNGYDVHGVV
jgi:superfamily I DNA/RNA helicase